MALVIRFVPKAGLAAAAGQRAILRHRRRGLCRRALCRRSGNRARSGDDAHVCRATGDRPVNIAGTTNWPPRVMYDTTLSKPIFLVPGSNPASWTDILEAAA
jgi:hypothetical protein